MTDRPAQDVAGLARTGSTRAADPAQPPAVSARSPFMIASGSFLLLSAGALALVLLAGDRAPLWMIGAWFVLALALSLVIGGVVPVSPRPVEPDRRADYARPNGVDPAITGEPREEQASAPVRDAGRDPQ